MATAAAPQIADIEDSVENGAREVETTIRFVDPGDFVTRRYVRAGAEINTDKMDLYLDDVLVAKNGGRHSAYREEQGVAAMKKPEFTVRAVLNRGKADATLWTCDFSFDYVKINAEYRT